MTKRNFRLGCIPSLHEHRRDFKFSLPVPEKLPSLVDLRSKMPPVYDQGNLGSCTANAVCGAIEYNDVREGQPDYTPARLFLYQNTLDSEGHFGSDVGCSIKDAVKTANRLGVCNEKTWPYDLSKFNRKPPVQAYAEGKKKFHSVLQYETVADLTQFKASLSHGVPVVLGFMVYESFFRISSSGMMPTPQPSERLEGGHAVLAVGYVDAKQFIICRNSWAASWGHRGYFYMPYALINSGDVFDCWSIGKV